MVAGSSQYGRQVSKVELGFLLFMEEHIGLAEGKQNLFLLHCFPGLDLEA